MRPMTVATARRTLSAAPSRQAVKSSIALAVTAVSVLPRGAASPIKPSVIAASSSSASKSSSAAVAASRTTSGAIPESMPRRPNDRAAAERTSLDGSASDERAPGAVHRTMVRGVGQAGATSDRTGSHPVAARPSIFAFPSGAGRSLRSLGYAPSARRAGARSGPAVRPPSWPTPRRSPGGQCGYRLRSLSAPRAEQAPGARGRTAPGRAAARPARLRRRAARRVSQASGASARRLREMKKERSERPAPEGNAKRGK